MGKTKVGDIGRKFLHSFIGNSTPAAPPITKPQLDTKIAEAQALVAALKAQLTTADPHGLITDIDAKAAELAQAKQSLDNDADPDLAALHTKVSELRAALDVHDNTLLSDELGACSLSDAQMEGLKSLRATNQDAADNAIKSLGTLAGRAPNVAQVDLAVMKTCTQQRVQAQKDHSKAKRDLKTARTERANAKAAYAEALKNRDAKRQEIMVAGSAVTQKQKDELVDLDAKLVAADAAQGQAKVKRDAAVAHEKAQSDAAIQAIATEHRARAQKAFSDALTSGLLTSGELSASSVKNLAKLLEHSPTLVLEALDRLPKAKDPNSVVETSVQILQHFNNNLSANGEVNMIVTPTGKMQADAYAHRLLDSALYLELDQASQLGPYLAAGRDRVNLALCDPDKSPEANGKTRADYVTDKAFNPDGTVNITQAKDAMLDVLFHPTALRKATPHQTMHMVETLEFFEGNAQACQELDNVGQPQPGATSVLTKAAGQKAPFAPDDKTSRHAIFSAMMTPVFQGKVGSCFATAQVQKMRKDDPEEMLTQLCDFATKGTYKPSGQTVEIPAVLNVQADENTLLRSYEYTVATATTRLAGNQRAEEFEAATENAFKKGISSGLKGKIDPKKLATVKTDILEALKTEFDYEYQIDENQGAASDGNSTSGQFALVRNGTAVKSEADYISEVADLLKSKIKPSDISPTATQADVDTLADTLANSKSFKSASKNAWKPKTGGFSDEVAEVFHGKPFEEEIVAHPKVRRHTKNKSVAKEVLVGLLNEIPDPTGTPMEDHVVIGTVGKANHAFTFLPNDPSLDGLSGATKAETAKNIKEQVLGPASKAAKAEMDVTKTQRIFDQQLEHLLQDDDSGTEEMLIAAFEKHRPTKGLTPKQLNTVVQNALKDANKAREAIWARNIQLNDAAKNITTSDKDALARARKIGKRELKDQANALKSQLVSELDLRVMKFADTNWGDPEDHVFFAMAPDPLTGELTFYRMYEPSGDLTPAPRPRDWLGCEWSILKEK